MFKKNKTERRLYLENAKGITNFITKHLQIESIK